MKRRETEETPVVKTTPSKLGLKLKELRTLKGMSLRELHSKSGVTASYIVRIEDGRKKIIGRGIVKALSEALDKDLTKYLSEVDF